jgi:capsular polysaccharide biosynthesis protein
MEKENVYIIQDCQNKFIFHWFLMMISALKIFDNEKKPVKFNTNICQDFHNETIELLKPDFEFITDIQNYNPVPINGSCCVPSDPYDLWEKDCYLFLRKTLLKSELINLNSPKRLLYISRNKSHQLECNHGDRKRQILNEDEVYTILEKKGFEYIHLEDYNLFEKIKLFQDAKIIVTPNGGALTMCLFAHKDTKVIEIHHKNTIGENQYYNICKNVDIFIERYSNVNAIDYNNNQLFYTLYVTHPYNIFIPDLNDFNNFIENYM